MTQFLSITDTGGRIGRIRWSNTSPRSRLWGNVWWDLSWPHQRPPLSRFAALFAEIADNAALAAQVLQSSVERATEAVRELGKAFGRLQ
jgi:hypothetical protein